MYGNIGEGEKRYICPAYHKTFTADRYETGSIVIVAVPVLTHCSVGGINWAIVIFWILSHFSVTAISS
jgi:hypothetical protein